MLPSVNLTFLFATNLFRSSSCAVGALMLDDGVTFCDTNVLSLCHCVRSEVRFFCCFLGLLQVEGEGHNMCFTCAVI